MNYFDYAYNLWFEKLNRGDENPTISIKDWPSKEAPVGGAKDWVDFCNGESAAKTKHVNDLGVAAFKQDFKVLCDKYKMDFHFGCGCCASIIIKDETGRIFDAFSEMSE